MSTTNKKAYVYKMNLLSANILCIIIFVLCYILTTFLVDDITIQFNNLSLMLLGLILYFALHEFLHGVGYYLGGTKRSNIQYGICLEKGILYAMAYQELSKKNILISLQMPFVVIGIITYIIGIIFNIPILILLSVVNISGACMDCVMFIYILRLKNNIKYSESGNPDEFVLITDEDLSKRKSIFLKLIEVKDYNKDDYKFPKKKKIVFSKVSIIILLLLIVLSIIELLL